MAAMAAACSSVALSSSSRAAASPVQRLELSFPSVKAPARLLPPSMGVFSVPALAGEALRAAHLGQPVSGRRVFTAVHASEVEEELDYADAPPSAPDAGTKLYVGNLPFNIDSAGLAQYFSDAGVVDQVDVIYDRETGRSRGFAFVTMATPEDAEAAIDRLDGRELGGRTLRVGFPVARNDRPARTERPPRSAPPAGTPGSGNKLYVGNLSWGMDDYGLADLFSEFGQVMEAKVVMDRETGKSRGFGFVTFGSSQEGNEAVNALDGAQAFCLQQEEAYLEESNLQAFCLQQEEAYLEESYLQAFLLAASGGLFGGITLAGLLLAARGGLFGGIILAGLSLAARGGLFGGIIFADS